MFVYLALGVAVFLAVLGILFDTVQIFSPGTAATDAAFANSYIAARHKFRMAADFPGAQLENYTVLEEDGLSLSIDTVFIRGLSNESILVHISGTHGVEGFAGSAIQVAELQRLRNSATRHACSILFVHALNPYGFHHLRRFNENNVDLNRNFFVSETERIKTMSRKPNVAGYDDVDHVINPVYLPQWWHRFTVIVSFILSSLSWDLKRSLVVGQYHSPTGINYGGAQLEKSQHVALDLARRFIVQHKVVVIIDVHSGLGPSGVDTMMTLSPAAASTARSIFPRHTVDEPISSSGASAGYDLARGISDWCQIVPHIRCDHICEEFGTVAGVFVLRALVLEAAAQRASPGSRSHIHHAQMLRDVFFVDEQFWKESVLQRGAKAIEDAVRYLS